MHGREGRGEGGFGSRYAFSAAAPGSPLYLSEFEAPTLSPHSLHSSLGSRLPGSSKAKWARRLQVVSWEASWTGHDCQGGRWSLWQVKPVIGLDNCFGSQIC